MLLSIIIISYNTKELLEECLKSIQSSIISHQPLTIEIIVVDNNSQDGSPEMINEQWIMDNEKKKNKSSTINHQPLTIKLIKNQRNLGFAKANNQGIKIAKGEYVLFLNSDTIVPQNTIPFMLNYIKKHPKVGVATCRVELTNGSLDDACHRGFPTPWNTFCHFSGLEKLFPYTKVFSGYSLGYLDIRKTHEIDACAGAFMMVPRKVGKQINWWDEDYFWYGEDVDFCYRIKEKRFKIMFIPEVKIIHYKGASSGIKKTKSKANLATKKRAMLASTQAMRIFYQKHYQGKYPWLIEKLVFGGIKTLERIRSWKVKKRF